jgi:hypothetical protein
MSKFTNRPMSEYEAAAFDVLGIIFAELGRVGGDEAQLKRRIIEAADMRVSFGASNGAAQLRIFAECVRD